MAKFIPRPDVVIVGHRTYRILWHEQSEWKKRGLDDGNRGFTQHAAGLIHLRLSFEEDEGENRASECMLREILLHELLHACSSVSMVWNAWDALKHDEQVDYGTTEELINAAQSPVLLTVIKQNPMLMAYLLDDQEHE